MVKSEPGEGKAEVLAGSRTLNPDPGVVTDPVFAGSDFFDARDLVQVKYEMVRKTDVDKVPVSRAAATFGFSRQSLYTARAVLREQGLAGLVPAKPGPKAGHKLTETVVDHLETLVAADPGSRAVDLVAVVAERFGVTVHPRSITRALARRAEARARQGAPKTG
jgi:transposase